MNSNGFDLKFLIGDVIIPIAIFVAGIFVGKGIQKKADSKIKGNYNTVIQNSKVDKLGR